MNNYNAKPFVEDLYANITALPDVEYEQHQKAERARIYTKYGSQIDKMISNHGGSIDNVLAPNVLKYVRDAMECYAVDKIIADDPLTEEYFWACVLVQDNWLSIWGVCPDHSYNPFAGKAKDPLSWRERKQCGAIIDALVPLIDGYAYQQIDNLIKDGYRLNQRSIDAGYFVMRDCTLREYLAGARERESAENKEYWEKVRRHDKSQQLKAIPLALGLALGLLALLALSVRSML